MTDNDYLIAWGLYAFAALGCLWVWFRMTGWMWRWLREPLRLVLAVLLLTPTLVDPAKELYAPAVAIGALDLLFKVGGNIWRAALDLSTYGTAAVVAYLLFAAIRWPFLKRANQRRAEAAAQAERAAKGQPEPAPVVEPAPEPPRRPRPPEGNGRLRVEPRL